MGVLHEAALAWAEAGFAVFPCLPRSKLPATENGFLDVTTDPEKITAWWTQNPSFNVAVAPAHSAMFVLDSDPPLGAQSLAALEAENGALPLTLTIRTPRGGTHQWFLGDAPSTVGKLGPKLDTRGRGGYVLVPPSYVVDKDKGIDGEYVYENDNDAIVDAPGWLLAAVDRAREEHAAAEGLELDEPANIERAVALLRGYAERGDVAIEGKGGDDRTYRLCCEVLNLGLSPAKTWEIVRDEYNPHCIPPWDEEELATKVQNAATYLQNEIGAWAVAPSSELFGGIALRLAAELPDTPAPKVNPRFYPRDEEEQDRRPEPSWLLPGILPANSTVMLYGPMGMFKSFLALDLALTLASGKAGYGTGERPPVDTVYVAAEGAHGIERLRRPAWKLAHGIEGPLRFFTIDTMPCIGRPQEIIEVIEAIKARGIKPRLLVLDTVARALAGKNENDARDAGEFIEAIELLKRELHCTVVGVHHTGKDEDRGGRGSSALGAGFDAVLEVKTRYDVRATAIYVRKMKDAEQAETPWAFEGREVGPSLVFFEIGTDAYRKLVKGDDAFGHSKIGAALRDLRAIGEVGAVTTMVLATHIVPPLQDDTPEARAHAITRCGRQLQALAKTKLEAYAHGAGKSLRWCLPATAADEF